MLHDPEMEVSCDDESCTESVYLPMRWSVGGYDLEDDAAAKLLQEDHNWLSANGKHFCEEHRKKQEVEAEQEQSND